MRKHLARKHKKLKDSFSILSADRAVRTDVRKHKKKTFDGAPVLKGPRTQDSDPMAHRHHAVSHWDCCCYNGCNTCHIRAFCDDCAVRLDHNPNTTRRAQAEDARVDMAAAHARCDLTLAALCKA